MRSYERRTRQAPLPLTTACNGVDGITDVSLASGLPGLVVLIAATPAEAILQNDIIDIAPFATWKRGRIVLLGDAAHPTTPNLGQGACMAIESAAVLAEDLARRDVDAAIAAYV